MGFFDRFKKDKGIELTAPMKGKCVSIKEVPDPTFAEEILGKGIAVIPQDGHVYAPADGKISTVFPTGHAVGITTADGAEILIHIGLDTVKLNGEHFTALVKTGDAVEVGTPLVQVDLKAVRDAGYDLVTPVLITNSAEVLDVMENSREHVEAGDEILTVIR